MLADPIRYIDARIGEAYDMRRANCWHLAGETLRALFGRALPSFPKRAMISRAARVQAEASFDGWDGWSPAPGPAHGALVLMDRAGCLRDIHAGVWLQCGPVAGCLHTNDPHGVVFDDMSRLRARGWDSLRFYVPAH